MVGGVFTDVGGVGRGGTVVGVSGGNVSFGSFDGNKVVGVFRGGSVTGLFFVGMVSGTASAIVIVVGLAVELLPRVSANPSPATSTAPMATPTSTGFFTELLEALGTAAVGGIGVYALGG